MKTVVIGSGSWGTALAQVLCDNGQDVLIYGKELAEIEDINQNHQNSRYFPDVKLNKQLKASADIHAIEQADIIVLAVPSKAIASVCQEISPLLKDGVIIINLAKGFDPDTFDRMSQVIAKNIDAAKVRSIISLIGPSHAEEVVVRQLTSIDAVSSNQEDARLIQKLFSNDYLRIYTGSDEAGSELGAAIKNVLAIASGILRGLGYKDNSLAALITRGLQEMIRFGTAFGGNPQTFIGLTGVGDLIVTCTSNNSRNFTAGYQIGKENSTEKFFAENTKTVEGIEAARIVHELARQKGLDLPICEEVYQILYEQKEPRLSASNLMLRELKDELIQSHNWRTYV